MARKLTKLPYEMKMEMKKKEKSVKGKIKRENEEFKENELRE